MFKSTVFTILLISLFFSCQTSDRNELETLAPDQNAETRSALEGEVYEFATAKLIYYPIYESSALYLGNDQNEVVKIFKLQGFLSYDNIYLNGTVKFGEKFIEVQSSNLPNAYFVFDTYLDKLSELVPSSENAYLNSEGYGLAARNALSQHVDLSYTDMISALADDGGDIYSIDIPCSDRNKIAKFCNSGGCGAKSCSIGGGFGGLTISGECACEVECNEGYYACCKDCEGCGCFPKACCNSSTN